MAHTLTARAAAELISHEGIVAEAYLDAGDVWTWGIGVTGESKHPVHPRYKDAPTEIRDCLVVFIRLLRQRYLPAVESVFADFPLKEHQFAAAVSFHYNTGAIETASWVGALKDGDTQDARNRFLLWNKPSAVIPRRKRECALLFDNVWSSDGTAKVFDVHKPSYKIDIASGREINILADLNDVLAGPQGLQNPDAD